MAFLQEPLVSVCSSALSIIAAVFTFAQYKNTKAIKRELENKIQNYDKAQIRGKLRLLIEKIVEKQNDSKKLLIGGKLNKEVSQVFSDIRSGSIYNDSSISADIKKCEGILQALGERGVADVDRASSLVAFVAKRDYVPVHVR